MITRRSFLGSSAACATALFAAPTGVRTPSPDLEKLGAAALAEAKKLGATYCDVRVNRYRSQQVHFSLEPGPGGTVNGVPGAFDRDSYGCGVRVIAGGAWGFAAAPQATAADLVRVTREAVSLARANAALKGKPVALAPVKAYRDRWTSSFTRNPFDIPLGEKVELLRSAAQAAKDRAGVLSSSASLHFRSEDKYFASSEGSSIQQFILQSWGNLSANAVDSAKGLSKSRSYFIEPLAAGWEYVGSLPWLEDARRIREEVLEHLAAPPVQSGKKDLVLMPSNLFLTIHESIGHSTELDRALGYEANFAGTSFLTLDKMGRERIASDIVTVYGDRTNARGLASVGYDDDGVKSVRFPIVDAGLFRHYQTTREMAPLAGENASNGCSYAESWEAVPFQRMPNVWLAPGKPETTLDDLIAGVDDGILIEGNGSYSIDQQRYNFQFGGNAFWEIKGGKKRGMLSRVAYQSRTTDFWRSCDGIAGEKFFQQFGTPNDGKGEPMQINAVSHGCAPARFRQINVIQTD